MVSGEGKRAARALEFTEQAAHALKRCGEGGELELAMSLHVTDAILCYLSRHADAVPVFELAVAVVSMPPLTAALGPEGEHEQAVPPPPEEEEEQQRKREEGCSPPSPEAIA